MIILRNFISPSCLNRFWILISNKIIKYWRVSVHCILVLTTNTRLKKIKKIIPILLILNYYELFRPWLLLLPKSAVSGERKLNREFSNNGVILLINNLRFLVLHVDLGFLRGRGGVTTDPENLYAKQTVSSKKLWFC